MMSTDGLRKTRIPIYLSQRDTQWFALKTETLCEIRCKRGLVPGAVKTKEKCIFSDRIEEKGERRFFAAALEKTVEAHQSRKYIKILYCINCYQWIYTCIGCRKDDKKVKTAPYINTSSTCNRTFTLASDWIEASRPRNFIYMPYSAIIHSEEGCAYDVAVITFIAFTIYT